MLLEDTGHWRGRARRAGMAGAVGALALAAGCQSPRPPPPPKGPLILAPTACADFSIAIYFEPGSASIDRAGEALLTAAGQRTKACSVTGVRVRGLADAPGSHDVNLTLSKLRAETVRRALQRRGFTQVEFQVTAIGDAQAESPSGDVRLMRRRVDVDIHLGPP